MSSGQKAAKKFMSEHGLFDVSNIPIELVATGLGATVIEKPMSSADGRIVFGNRKTIITINSGIEYEGKRRFTIGHEIGHLRMHKDHFLIHNDNDATLEYFKSGHQETEANEFASELLMPKALFRKISDEYEFGPELLRYLADYFKTSITSVAYRYFEYGNHPICLIYSYGNTVKYWKRPDPYDHFIKDRNGLTTPDDSVASEFFKQGKIYSKKESKQKVWKSTWFELKPWENDKYFNFYEYCIVTPKYNTVLSVVWEE
ncbi:Zn-dependent peptidase ImmA, M78 family [Algoriphagus faecimaris]|uniref:Zn-dependent peptidase ImmA, M78 family n=1 Tax=Algoriphagus faecimaris TaxID=686796 RepID=A0A1G6Y5S2_9BACT|nr:ImmA/IrrE family metallo-endopeptidase [Algoriphagus faecimaris]SDD85834.1 Zn-dependent peptidase ImmA, M78 family [Algoriphagus faecimaris]